MSNLVVVMVRCGAKNRTKPGRCRNRVTHQGELCHKHRDRGAPWPPPKAWTATGRRRGGGLTRSASRTTPFVPEQRSTPSPVSARPDPSARPAASRRRDTPRWIGDVAAETLTGGWRAAVAAQLAPIAADAVWPRVGRRRQRQFDCAALAELADALDEAKTWAHDATGALARGLFRRMRRPEPEQALAEALAKRIPLPGDKEIDEVVRCLRIVGVYVCLVGHGDILRCPCLIALAKDRTKEELKSVLRQKLDGAFPMEFR